jgi:phosphoribosyl 1,2-cyclic phosphate phosphodiesterase
VSLSIRILGCGSSGGVPRVAQGWGACDPANPKNRRSRCSILVERHTEAPEATTVLVDTGPDLRDQLLDAGASRLDAVLLTHNHADHTHGMDDVRPLVLKMKRLIDVYMDEPTAEGVHSKFGYIFETPPGSSYPPLMLDRRLTPLEAVSIAGPGGAIEALPFRLEHGEIDALGFRFGDVAYSPDVNGIPPESIGALEGLDLWIVDALRYTSHPSHFSLRETLEWIEKLRPRRAVLTNLHTDLDYETLRGELPKNVEPAYDGMILRA